MGNLGKTAVVIVAAITGTIALGSRAAQEPPGTSATSAESPSAESIRQWIRELDDDEYVVREAATQNLITAASEAMPMLIEASQSYNLEIGSRVFHILMAITESPDPLIQKAALDALEEIAKRPDSPAGQRAAIVLEPYKQARHEQATEAISALGGTVVSQQDGSILVRLGNQWQGKAVDLMYLSRINKLSSLSLEDTPVGDDVIVHLVGLADIQRLFLGNSEIKGPGLARLKDLPGLNYLSLVDLELDDSALEHIGTLTNLEYLGLDGTPTNDDDLKHLEKLTRLERLWLNRTEITDEGLVHLKNLKSLTQLDLVSTRIDGSGLVYLKPLDNLKFLSLKGTKLSDEGFAALGQLTQLESLGIDDVRLRTEDVAFGDAQLVEIAKLKNLTALWLTNSAVTDAGMKHLRELQSLEKVYLQGTSVTSLGVAELREALPTCRVYR